MAHTFNNQHQENARPHKSRAAHEAELAAADPERDAPSRTADDLKDLHQKFTDLSSEELRQIPVLREGTRLEAKSTYLKLVGDRWEEVHGAADEVVGPNDVYLWKTEVPYELWNRLKGMTDPRRTHLPK